MATSFRKFLTIARCRWVVEGGVGVRIWRRWWRFWKSGVFSLSRKACIGVRVVVMDFDVQDVYGCVLACAGLISDPTEL
jgi:hypothetical protein